MKLTIKLSSSVSVDVFATEKTTTKMLKAQVYRTGKIMEAMRMSYGGKAMINESTLAECNVKSDTVIEVQTDPSREIKISFDVPGKGKIKKKLKNTITVYKVLRKLADEDLISTVDGMQLLFGDLGLEEEMPLHYYGITDAAIIEVQKSLVSLLIEDNHGDVLFHRIDPHCLVSELKAEITQYQGFYKALKPSTFHMTATDPTMFNGSINPVHHGPKHINVKAMRLYMKKGNDYEEMPDDNELSKYALKDKSMIYLVVYRWGKPFEIQRQKPPYETITVFGVESEGDTILSLKLRLQEQHAIPVSQRALCLGRKEEYGPTPSEARCTYIYEYNLPFAIL